MAGGQGRPVCEEGVLLGGRVDEVVEEAGRSVVWGAEPLGRSRPVVPPSQPGLRGVEGPAGPRLDLLQHIVDRVRAGHGDAVVDQRRSPLRGLLEIVEQGGDPEVSGDRGSQHLRLDRFGQVAVCATDQAEGLLPRRDGHRGPEDDRDTAPVLVGLPPVAELDAVAVRQVDIEQHEVGPLVQPGVFGLGRRGGGDQLVSGVTKCSPCRQDDRRRVVDDEDHRTAHRSSPSAVGGGGGFTATSQYWTIAPQVEWRSSRPVGFVRKPPAPRL